MPSLFSYVVHHDHGYSPCPTDGLCTLAKCKYGRVNKLGSYVRNLVEMAEVGDWVCGTGGAGPLSAGAGQLLYAMKVDRKIPLAEYCGGTYSGRIDAEREVAHPSRCVLLSTHFYYFGRNAIELSAIPPICELDHSFEKAGQGYRRDFDEGFVERFAGWIEANFKVGVHGEPCDPDPTLDMATWPDQIGVRTEPTSSVTRACRVGRKAKPRRVC